MEHRWGNRLEVRRPVRLRTRAGLVAQGLVSNVSISGAFIVTPLPARLFSYVCVHLLAEDRRVHAQVEGQVVRRTPEGFALEWCEFAPDVIREIAALPAPSSHQQRRARRDHGS